MAALAYHLPPPTKEKPMEEERCTCDKKQQSPLCNTCIKYAIADDYANVGERCARCGEVTVCARCDKPAALIFAPAVNYDEREREDEDDDSEEGITTPCLLYTSRCV